MRTSGDVNKHNTTKHRRNILSTNGRELQLLLSTRKVSLAYSYHGSDCRPREWIKPLLNQLDVSLEVRCVSYTFENRRYFFFSTCPSKIADKRRGSIEDFDERERDAIQCPLRGAFLRDRTIASKNRLGSTTGLWWKATI